MPGLVDLRTRIEAAKRSLTAKIVRICKEGVKDMEREAKQNATTQPRVRTGNLRNEIAGVVTIKGNEITYGLLAGTRKSTAYAAAQEFGINHTPATHFLRRAIRKWKPIIDGRVRRIL